MKRAATLAAAFALAAGGCAGSGVLQAGPGEYIVSETGTSPAFRGTQNAIRKVHKQAAAFCAQSGQIVDTIELDTTEQRLGKPGGATLRFRCVNED